MYFQSIPSPQGNGYSQQQASQMYNQNSIYPMPQQPIQQPINPFMYPTKLQPYNDREFLCKTFNFRVPFIEAFLSLQHEEKLKFFLICESRRLTGQLTDKETYSRVLEKITMIINPNYKKPQQPEYKPITEDELKKNILEKEFEQKCEWQLRKLGMGDEMRGFNQSGYSTQNNNLMSGFYQANPSTSNSKSMMNGSQSMNFDEFGMFGTGQITQQTTQQILNSDLNNKQDEDEFFYQQQQPQPESVNQWAYSTVSMITKDFQSSTVGNQGSLQAQQSHMPVITQQLAQQSQSQTLHFQNHQSEQQEWQQAQQTPQIHPQSQYYSQQPVNLQHQPQHKVQSIWDLQINEQQVKQSQPDIKQIFGIISNQEDDFGGFEEGNVQMCNHDNNASSFLRQNEFRYETVAEVNNDWLMGVGVREHSQNAIDVPLVTANAGGSDKGLDIMGDKQTYKSNYSYTEHQWSFDHIRFQPQKQMQQVSNPQSLSTQISITNPQSNTVPFDINNFDISLLVLPPQTQPEAQSFKNNDNQMQSVLVSASDFDFGAETNRTTKQNEEDLSITLIADAMSDLHTNNLHVEMTEKNNHEDQQWNEGQEVAVESNELNINSNKPAVTEPQQPQQITCNFKLPTYSNHNSSPVQPFNQPRNYSTNYDPFDTIELAPSTQIPQNQTYGFSSILEPSLVSQNSPIKVQDSSSVVSQKEIKPIRKIIKPPSMIQIESSNFNHFSSDINQANEQQLPNLLSIIQPVQLKETPQIPQPQPQSPSLFTKKPKLTAVNSLNLSIVPSLNMTVGSPRNLPPVSMSLTHIPNQMSISNYFATSKPQPKQQKIISTYNKQMTYTPDSFRSSMKTMLSKSKTFFKAFSRDGKKNSDKEIAEQKHEPYSMLDLGNGLNRDSLTGSQKVEAVYSPKVSSRGFGTKKGLDYSIDANMNQESGNKDFYEYDNNDANDLQALDQNESRFNATRFNKRQVSNTQESKVFTAQGDGQSQINSSKEVKSRQERQQILLKLSKRFILKLPENEVNYLSSQLKKNNFFFNQQFYIKLKQTLERLSLSQDLTHFLKSLARSKQRILLFNPQSSLFSSQLTFIEQIIKKLSQIDELNKKFTLAMEDEQEEELAEVVMKSKQLTFEVNEDGEMAKRIVGLVLEARSSHAGNEDSEVDEDTDKYYGLYYMMVKLLLQRQPAFTICPIPQQNLTHLTNIYNDASSPSLSSKSKFLFTCTMLYLLHVQLNQLQYIKNISQTIFAYLIKQHAILMRKINEIKQLSNRYAESPHSIFSKLMESTKMTEYLQGLGEMAMVAERLSQIGRKVGVKFDKEEFSEDRLARTIAECKQLAKKYNLLNNDSNQPNSESSYTPYLTVFLSTTNSGKSVSQISLQMLDLLRKNPVCKVCLAPRRHPGQNEGSFINKTVGVSSRSLESRESVEWCHYSCYNMLKMAFEDMAESSME